MRLVVAQGETIQTQLRRLNQRETQIETYEQQMHLLRVQNLGTDYLLSSYLHDQHNQPQECPPQSVNPLLGSVNPLLGSHSKDFLIPNSNSSNHNTSGRLTELPTFGERLVNVSRSSTDENNVQQAYLLSNNSLLPGIPIPREVHAKPIHIDGNEFNFPDNNTSEENLYINSNFLAANHERFRNRFTTNDETFGSEEKSNDSGVVLADDSLGTSVEERQLDVIEEFSDGEVQERLLLLSKMEDVLTRLLHEEEVIHGLSSTLEVIQTQQKLEATDLELDLKRAAEEHALLVSEVRANEQQIRVLDTSAAQKKKLIDALLQEEVDSDQQTQSLRAHLDYILHLPPTAFRLPEEGDDPPPLPPPPAYPVCLLTSQMLTLPNSVSIFPNRNIATLKSPHLAISSYIARPPSPNPVHVNRAPSPNIFSTLTRRPSPILRGSLHNRSCSPNKRKPLQPPPYDHTHKNIKINLSNTDAISSRVHNGSCNVLGSNSNHLNCKCSNKNENCPNNISNNLKSSQSNSMCSLPNKNISLHTANKNTNLLNGSDCSVVKALVGRTVISHDENSDDTPPPLPLCPPPPLTPDAINTDNVKNGVIIDNLKSLMSSNTYNNASGTDVSASKRCQLLTTLKNAVNSGTKSTSLLSELSSDDSSRTSSSLCVSSSRSSTASDNSAESSSNASSSSSNMSTNPPSKMTAVELANNNSNVNQLVSKTQSNIHSIEMNGDVSFCKKIVNQSTLNDKSRLPDQLKLKQSSIVSSVISNNGNLNNNGTHTSSLKKDTNDSGDNSDTGLSSLHSSSDEAAYALDTLV